MKQDIWVALDESVEFEQWCDDYGFEHAVTGWLHNPITDDELTKYIVSHKQVYKMAWLKKVWCDQ